MQRKVKKTVAKFEFHEKLLAMLHKFKSKFSLIFAKTPMLCENVGKFPDTF